MVCWSARKPLSALASSFQSCACSTSSLASSLRLSAQESSAPDGLRAHHTVVCLGLEQTKLLANLLVHMYGSCGRLQEAALTFQNLPMRDCFSWNYLAIAYARCGHSHDSLQVIVDMYHESISPDQYVFGSILSVCAEKKDPITGMHIHFLIMWEMLELDESLQNAILNVYTKCLCLEDARAVFLGIEKKNDASYNSILSCYASCGQSNNTIICFTQMMMEGLMPNQATFITLVCACTEDVRKEGHYMHARMAVSEYKSSLVLSNALISMYGRLGDLKGAVNIFDSLVFRNTVSWNSLIVSHALHGKGRNLCEFFDRIHQEGELPNSITFRSLSPGFEFLDRKKCKHLHVRVLHDAFYAAEDATRSLIYMYCKCGCCTDAFQVFDLMPERDLRIWNALNEGVCHQSAGKAATWHFSQMLQEGVLPDKVTFLKILSGHANQMELVEGIHLHAVLATAQIHIDVLLGSALLNMYGKCGDLKNALILFSTMAEKNKYSWAAMISAYALQGDIEKSLILFERMHWEGIQADKVSILCLLFACASQTSLNFCKHVHTLVVESGLHRHIAVQNSLLTMYSKCGSLTGTNCLFKKMREKNLISWTSMITACAQHGQGKEVFHFFQEMQNEGFYPDDVTFIEILSACSRAGLSDEACFILTSMKQHHDIEPTFDHLNCIVDLFCRVGRLDLAEHLILNMQDGPNNVSWLTLLGTCRSHLDLEHGKHVINLICNASSNEVSPFVMVSNLYASSNRVN